MEDTAAPGGGAALPPTTTTSIDSKSTKNVHKQLRGMGFHEQDLARATEMCGGLSTIEGSLNWLLLHCPEERVPKDLATTGGGGGSVIQRARQRRKQKKAAPKKTMDVSKMTDKQRCVHNIASLGFDREDAEFCVNQARKSNWYPEALKALFEYCNIRWHHRCIVGKDGDVTSATIKQAKAREKAALNALYPADTGIFKVLGGRSDAWRLKFRVTEFKVAPGEDISRWSDVAVKNWVRSVTYKEGLDPKTVRAVCREVGSGRELIGLERSEVTSSSGWALTDAQSNALFTAIAHLHEQSEDFFGGGAGDDSEFGVFDTTRADCISLNLDVYWPKQLVEGARTARASRYPYETPLFVLGGWNRIEEASGVVIPLESKRRVLKALAEKSIALMKSPMTAGKPVMRQLVKWTNQHILDLVPELQVVLILLAEGKDGPAATVPVAPPVAVAKQKIKTPPEQKATRTPQPRPLPLPTQTSKKGASSKTQHQRQHQSPVQQSSRKQQSNTRQAREESSFQRDNVNAAATASAPAANTATTEREARDIVPVKKKKLPPRSAAKMRAAEKRLEEQAQKIEKQKEMARVRKEQADKQTAERLRTNFLAQQKRPEYLKMLAGRKKLPAMREGRQEEILKSIESNQVVVISGATGCGKSTQVPQIILDAMLLSGHGARASIICTQPRRLAAIGVGERVASERAERCGDTVGYQIRLESKRSRNTRLLFCTTGILLRTLEGDRNLSEFSGGNGVSHVIVDEGKLLKSTVAGKKTHARTHARTQTENTHTHTHTHTHMHTYTGHSWRASSIQWNAILTNAPRVKSKVRR
jgi:hypothetical protein